MFYRRVAASVNVQSTLAARASGVAVQGPLDYFHEFVSGLLSQSHTRTNKLLLSFDSKFANEGAAHSCELRNRDTRAGR